MIKKVIIIPALLLLYSVQINAQENKQGSDLKREVTLYNPYKPSISDAQKKSFLPDIADTLKTRHDFQYNVTAEPFMPEYKVSPLKAAALLPDPLPKLYKSFINMGLGSSFTPLAELSITNERSKKGAIGFYGRHFSSNGFVPLQNGIEAFDGFMDNDASLFGRRFIGNSQFAASLDYTGKTRYAYGYDTSYTDYSATKKDIRLNYNNFGGKFSISSLTTDSSDFYYDFKLKYNYFTSTSELYEHNFGIDGTMKKKFSEFYVGSGISYDYYSLPKNILSTQEYIFTISPFLSKNKGPWSFRVGLQAAMEKNLTSSVRAHLYPDLDLKFSVVPSYVTFFADLSGKLERNNPLKIINDNPYILPGTLYKLYNTDHAIIVSAGLKGNNGVGGNYLVSASWSVINDMLLYSNLVSPPGTVNPETGNHFLPVYDNSKLLDIHGEMTGTITDKIAYNCQADFYKYSMTYNEYAWNKPNFDGQFGLKYNLRNKIIAGAGITIIGKRMQQVRELDPTAIYDKYEAPLHMNLNLSAEYRYSKILSVWTKLNNISWNRYYEWAYYPTQGFLFMLGFSYSL
jgi:hypothetical protein